MRFFSQLLGFILLFAAATATQGTPPAEAQPPFQLKLIGPNIWAAIDDAKGDAGANAGFVIGDSGVVVIDTFENETAAKALLTEIRKRTHLPVKFVVNTHYHLDHVAGNRVFSNAGAVIVAHENLRGWINTENLKFFGEKIKPEEKSLVAQLLGPEVSYDSAVTLFLGSRRINVQPFAGHTGGDSVVSIPDAGVVFCGDLFWRKTLPNLIDATTSAWINTLSDLAVLPAQPANNSTLTRAEVFVPGHGDVGTSADVLEFKKYLEYLRATVKGPADNGKTGDDLVNAVLPDLTKTYGTLDFFKDFSRSNILDVAAELRGLKRVPPPDKK